MPNPRKVKPGAIQVNVKLDLEMLQILQGYVAIKRLRTLQDGLRLMVIKAKDFVAGELKRSSNVPAQTPSIVRQSELVVSAPEAEVFSDDGMRPPSPVRSAIVNEDGDEPSLQDKIRANRAKPAMNAEEAFRFPSHREEL